MYHRFFIHSSVDVLLAIVNSAAMNNAMCVSFSIRFPQGICLGVGLLGCMVVLFLVFKGISIPSSIVAVSVYIPTNSAEAFPFLHTFFRIYCLYTFWWWPCWLLWGDVSLWFWFAFLLIVWITINCGKFWKRWEYQTTWSASWEICMQIRKQQLELDMEQQIASK